MQKGRGVLDRRGKRESHLSELLGKGGKKVAAVYREERTGERHSAPPSLRWKGFHVCILFLHENPPSRRQRGKKKKNNYTDFHVRPGGREGEKKEAPERLAAKGGKFPHLPPGTGVFTVVEEKRGGKEEKGDTKRKTTQLRGEGKREEKEKERPDFVRVTDSISKKKRKKISSLFLTARRSV